MMNAAIRTGGGIAFGTRAAPKAPCSGEVTVRVRCASINPVDYKLPAFSAGPVAGIDVSGVVESVADDVKHLFSPGDEVFGFSNGSVCELTTADASKLARKPPSLTHREAAALPTAHLTSFQALFVHGALPKRNARSASVLVLGASGGCGLSALALARAAGADEIVAVCSAANAELARSRGATACVDYGDAAKMRAFAESSAGRFDVVYDAATGSGAGEAYGALAAEVVKPETGRRVALNGGLGFWFRTLTGWQRTRDVGMLTRQNGAELEEILAFPGDAARPVVDSTYPLTREGVRDAFERLKSRRARGKIVIDVA